LPGEYPDDPKTGHHGWGRFACISAGEQTGDTPLGGITPGGPAIRSVPVEHRMLGGSYLFWLPFILDEWSRREPVKSDCLRRQPAAMEFFNV
jgi:hypothetical protein